MLSSRPLPLGMESQILPLKTPGRLKGRVENAIPPATMNGKGKEAALRTPFHRPNKDPFATQTQLKPAKSTARPAHRPLGDKTPFVNRTGGHHSQTPAPQLKTSCLESQTQLQSTKTPDALLRPSTARKHVRVPRSASKSFETPLNMGNHWDVSELSIVLPDVQVQETVPEDDDDEIEYMAPNTLDLPYQPPFDFDLPNYKEVGKTLRNLAQSYPCNDIPHTEVIVGESDIVPETWNMLVLPELVSDDPFHRLEIPAAPKPLKRVPTTARGAADLKGINTQVPIVISKPVKLSRAAPVARASKTITTSSAFTSRPGTSASVSIPASRGMGKPSVPSNARAAISRKPTANDKVGGRAPMQSSVPSVKAIPSRPATSNAVRSRAPSIHDRQPTTSASLYKTTPANMQSRNFGNRLGTERNTGSGADAGEDLNVLIRGDLDLQDDFRFDV